MHYLQEYNECIENGIPHILLDVRPEVQFDICRLPNTVSKYDLLQYSPDNSH